MIQHHQLPSEQVPLAVASLRASLPEYEPLLAFYEHLFVAQENSRLEISLEPVIIEPDVLALKRRERLPLIDVTEFVFDPSAGERLLIQICRILQDSDNEMATAAARVAAAVGSVLVIEPLFRNLLTGGDDYYNETAGHIGCDKQTLAFVAYNSLKPSLAGCADQLSTYLKDPAEWRSGLCPVCGNLPAIGTLDAGGQRYLHCSFCWHAWPMPRVLCPFCSNTDGKMLNYLYSEAEKAYRVNCCEKCRKYIKEVDARSTHRPIYPALEQVASLHMDIAARNAGFESGIPLQLPID